jgi:branched-chain amino acid transport system permease protein
LGSFDGAILAGMILGSVESLSVILFSSEWKDVVAFGIFILVLAFRPSGLFGTKEW